MMKRQVRLAARSPGRRPGTDSTRAQILNVAREAFGVTGFDGTTLRSVAAAADVDPSTIIHFFGSKDGLFSAVIGGFKPATQSLVAAFRLGAPGRELVRRYLGLWEDEGLAMRALIRSSLASERATHLFRQSLLQDILEVVTSADPLGLELALTQLIGIGVGRYIARLPELAEVDIETVSARVGPVLDTYLMVSDQLGPDGTPRSP